MFDLFSHLLIGRIIAVFLWPYTGAFSLIVPAVIIVYLTNAWTNADMIVAAKAGFRPPTLVQQRYFEHLGTGQTIYTHPSLLPIAGVLVSSRRRLIILTSGALKELPEGEVRRLVAELSSRDAKAVFAWTFHLATGARRLFTKPDKDDPQANWGRKTVAVGLIGGVMTIVMAVLIAAPISMVIGRAIDISRIVPVLWAPFVAAALWYTWQRVNAALIKPGAAGWNTAISLEKVVFRPMSEPLGGHPNLVLMRSGLLLAEKYDDE